MARTIYLRASAVVAGALAALVVLAALGDTPAEAKKKKRGGLIVFSSNRNIDGLNPENDLEIFSMNSNGTGLKQRTFNAVLDDGAVISPDGTKMAYSSRENVKNALGQDQNPTGARQIWVIDLTVDVSNRTQLTFNSADSWTPDWSPDGTKIAFTRGTGFGSELYVMDADGNNQTPLTNNQRPDFRPAHSPDGTKIAYTSMDDAFTDFEIFEMPAGGGGRQPLTDNNTHDYRPEYSPDGKKIVYDSAGVSSLNPEGDFDVMKMSAFAGSASTNLTQRNVGDDLRPSFSPSGKIIYENLLGFTSGNPFASPNSVPGELFVMNADGSRKRNLTETGTSFINQLPDWGRSPRAR